MASLIEKICDVVDYDHEKVSGYTNSEMQKIELLYDIKLQGELRQFMSEMGRSDGGLIGDDPIILYRPTWSVRSQIMFQLNFVSLMQEDKNFDHLKEKPFVFSWESEHLYSFLNTESDNPNNVFSYDENSGEVEDLNITFVDFLRNTTKFYNREYFEMTSGGEAMKVPNRRNKVVCRGELLIV